MTITGISIIIPVKPGGETRALAAVQACDYPSPGYELLVAEGVQPSRQRNRAAAMAAGELIYFLDDDSLPEHLNLRRLAQHFSDSEVVAVGGPSLTPATDGSWQQGFGLALGSLLGGGGVRNRYRKTGVTRPSNDSELILCNLAFRAAVFREHGGFDERLYPNEENEFLERLRRRGGKILHDPELSVFRSQRPSFGAFVRQMYTYGRGRGEQTRLGGGFSPLAFAPSLFLCYLFSLLVIHNPLYYLPLVWYAVTVVLFAGYEAAAAGRTSLAPLLVLIFPTLHCAYGAGIFRGLATPRYRGGHATGGAVTVRVVKAMGECPQEKNSSGADTLTK